ncbi:lysophospholipid acyltransferase family protein [Persicimonas caeni]|uniref:lysophospholipid acyltransferase family protein n=1 Tax=Persicimonas caeni TaxID=2292766 RepID=UPI00143D83D9|nr:lysophospholipid acyltransferase family protein [Persicimonas caeni]
MSETLRKNRKLYRRVTPIIKHLERYFHPQVDGLDRIPDGPALLVGNHNGGVMAPDMFIFLRHFAEHTNFQDVPVPLAHDALFRVPGVKQFLESAGAQPASREHAIDALCAGRKVLVYPGGDWETHRPSSERDKIDFGGRNGFIKIALRANVPIVPVVSAGAHDGWFVITRGDQIAHKLKLDKLFRIKVFPIALGAPFGLVLGPASIHVPLPSDIRIQVLEPVCLDGSVDDAYNVEEHYRHITDAMQGVLTRLARELRGKPN